MFISSPTEGKTAIARNLSHQSDRTPLNVLSLYALILDKVEEQQNWLHDREKTF